MEYSIKWLPPSGSTILSANIIRKITGYISTIKKYIKDYLFQLNLLPAGPMLLNILWRSSNLTGPEDVTSLVASTPKFGIPKFAALFNNKIQYI